MNGTLNFKTMNRGITYGFGFGTGKTWSSKLTPITEEFLKQKFRATTENAGNMPCFKIDILTHTNRTMTIAKWTHDGTGEQEWQVWLDTYDLCRIKYVEQLMSLMNGLNTRIYNK